MNYIGKYGVYYESKLRTWVVSKIRTQSNRFLQENIIVCSSGYNSDNMNTLYSVTSYNQFFDTYNQALKYMFLLGVL